MYAENAGPRHVPPPGLVLKVIIIIVGLKVMKSVLCRDVWNVMDISVVSCAILSFYFK